MFKIHVLLHTVKPSETTEKVFSNVEGCRDGSVKKRSKKQGAAYRQREGIIACNMRKHISLIFRHILHGNDANLQLEVAIYIYTSEGEEIWLNL